jgi:hypothetical protein
MRTARRLLLVLFLTGVAAAVVSFYEWPEQWLAMRLDDLVSVQDRRSSASVTTSTLPTYARTVAGKPWFQRYFTRLAFSDEAGPNSHTGEVTKWRKRRVRIDILNSGGPGMNDYVRDLARRLNRMQSSTRFTLVNGPADVTIEYLTHDAYALAVGDDSVGNCETRFFSGAPGLVSATIKIDAGVLDTPAERQPVVVHELTHALGFKGHFTAPGDRTRSVLYYAAAISDWSQNDGAAIRIMYSSHIKNGMNVTEVRRALRRIAAD